MMDRIGMNIPYTMRCDGQRQAMPIEPQFNRKEMI